MIKINTWRRFRLLRVIFFCFFLGATTSGCTLFAVIGEAFSGDDVVEPQIPLEDKVVLVIPFKDDLFWYYGSDRGKELASSIVAQVIKNQDYSTLKAIYQDDRLENYFRNFREVSWKKVAEDAKADLVLFGEIDSFQTRRPKDVGLQRGKAKAKFKIYDAESDRIVLQKRVAVKFPKQVIYGVYAPDDDPESSYIQSGLIRQLAYKIGRELYTYPKADHQHSQ